MTDLVLSGHIPALVTPLRPDGHLDVGVLGTLVERAFAHGSSAVLVAGSTGEGPLLSSRARAELFRQAVVAAKGSPVIACTSGASVEDLLGDIRRAGIAGASAALVLVPSYFPLSPREQVDVFTLAAERSAIPVLAYHIPQATGSHLDPAAVATLAAHPGIIGIKDSSGDLDRLQRFVEAVDGTDFLVFQGNGPTVHDALSMGVAGSITAVANVRPELVAELHAAVAAGDEAVATAAQAELARVSHVLSSQPGAVPVAIKAALQLEDVIPSRTCVPPLHDLADDAVTTLREGLATPG